MDKKEKGLLLQALLEDIRGNWGWDLSPRVRRAKELAAELNLKKTTQLLNEFEWDDGRHFRCDFELSGGYENMECIHGLPFSVKGRSAEFLDEAKELLTYPENRFFDWEALSAPNEQKEGS